MNGAIDRGIGGDVERAIDRDRGRVPEHLRPYVSDLLAGWPAGDPAGRELDGSFMFADISGFTRLSEELGSRGREGAELVNLVISTVLSGFIAAARRRGGDVLAFGGDAILVHFAGSEATSSAAAAAAEMHASVAEPLELEGLGTVAVAVSIGINDGTGAALRVPLGSQVEALAIGPTVTRTLRAEGAATAGQTLLTHSAAERIPLEWQGAPTAHGVLMRDVAATADGTAEPELSPASVPIRELLSPAVADIAGTRAGEGQHRRAAVGFVRLGRMDEVVAERGIDAAHTRLSEVAGVLAAQCARTGSHILTVDAYPDAVKLLVCAGAPQATHDNEGALLEALTATVDRLQGMDIHVGAHRGLVFAGDLGSATRRGYTLIGDTVNLAARLMQRAEPGEILATDDLAGRTHVSRTPLTAFRVKGKQEPVNASRIGRGEQDRATVDLPIVGRDAEVAEIGRVVDRVLAESSFGGIDLVAPAGFGKSRLMREIVNLHPELDPFIGRATAYSTSTPYGLARRLLRVLLGIPRQIPADEAGRWLQDLVDSAAPELFSEVALIATAIDATVDAASSDLPRDPAVVQRRTARAVSQLVGAVRTDPMIVVIDDAQWLDDASRHIIQRLAMDGEHRPWLILAAHRPEGEPLFTGLDGCHTLQLDRLDDADADALVLAAAGDNPLHDADVRRVVQRAQGNCLFLIEYARSGEEEIPDDVETLIARRLDRVPMEQRAMLEVAAVVGTTVDLFIADAAAETCGIAHPEGGWLVVDEFLVQLRGGVLTWRDPVFREATYSSLPFHRRRELHRGVFEAIERAPSDGSLARAVALATHADKGEMAAEAWELLRKTGEQAALDGSCVDAVDLLTRAMRWADELGSAVDSHARLSTLEALGLAAELAGHNVEGAEALGRALLETDDVGTSIRLLADRSRLQLQMGEVDVALQTLAQAEAMLGQDDGMEDERSRLLLVEATIAYRLGDYDTAFARIEEVVNLDSMLVSPTIRARAFMVGDAIVSEGGGSDWMVGRGLNLYDVLGDDFGVAKSQNNVGNVAYRDGDWDRALHHWQESLAAHNRAGSVQDAKTSQVNIAELRGDQGDWESALEVMLRARESWRAGRYRIAIAFVTSLIGRQLARQGHHDDALEELDRAASDLSDLGAGDMAVEARLRAVEACWLAGETTQARRRLLAVDDDSISAITEAFAVLLRAAIDEQDGGTQAEHEYARAARIAARHKRWGEYLMAHVLRARARGVDPSRDVDVRALGQRLGVWRVATDTGEVRLAPPPD